MNEDDEIKNVDWDGKHTSIILSTPYPTEMVKPINKKPSTKKTPEEIKEFFVRFLSILWKLLSRSIIL